MRDNKKDSTFGGTKRSCGVLPIDNTTQVLFGYCSVFPIIDAAEFLDIRVS